MRNSKWEIKTLPEVAFFQEGPGVRNSQYTTQGVKLLNVANLQEGKVCLSNSERYISNNEAYSRYSHFLVDEGDLIIASSGIQVDYFHKKIGFISKEHLPLCLNTSTIRFKSLDNNKLNLRYLMYFLKSNHFKNQIAKLITGSAQLNFGPSHLKQISIFIAPLEIQQKIADVLDKAQELIEKRKEQIEKLDEFLKSVFLEMFGDPIKNTKKWELKKLGDICKIERGRFSPRPRNDPSYYNGEFPFIQTGDISICNHRLSTWKQTLNKKGIRVSKRFEIGTIVVAIVGATIGATAILGKQIYAPDSIVGITIGDNLLTPEYIEFVLRFWKPIFIEQAPSTARANLNLETFKPLLVPIPPANMQREFTKISKKTEQQRELMEKSLVEMQNNFNSLMQRAFKGELF